MTDIEIELGVSKFNNIRGVTCYMNSILAILQQTPIFTDYIVCGMFKKNLVDKYKATDLPQSIFNSITYQLHNLLKISLMNDDKILTPLSFRRVISRKDNMWGQQMQQDSQEFLTFLLTQLENEVSTKVDFIPGLNFDSTYNNKSTIVNIIQILANTEWIKFIKNEYSPIKTLFTGMTRMITECKHCSNQSNNFEIFQTLQLSIPTTSNMQQQFTLDECMEHYISPEILDKDNMMKCNFCFQKNQSKKHTKIWKTPKILIIHIKRFMVNMYGQIGQKINNMVSYPIENLNISKYVDTLSPDIEMEKTTYNLYAVNCHHNFFSGAINTINSGHYTSLVKNRYNNNWYKFDDNEVNEIYDLSKIENKNAYMLFYYRNN